MKGDAMFLLFLEAIIAVLILIAIVWWTWPKDRK